MSCNNVNTTGSTTPSSAEIDFYLAVAKGDFTGYSNVSKFGINSTVGSGGFESIWEGSSLYPWPTDVQTLSVVSASANDASGGTGARTVEIQGLDTNWDVVTETITMNGVTPVVTTQTFRRVFRAKVVTAGSLARVALMYSSPRSTSLKRPIISSSVSTPITRNSEVIANFFLRSIFT